MRVSITAVGRSLPALLGCLVLSACAEADPAEGARVQMVAPGSAQPSAAPAGTDTTAQPPAAGVPPPVAGPASAAPPAVSDPAQVAAGSGASPPAPVPEVAGTATAGDPGVTPPAMATAPVATETPAPVAEPASTEPVASTPEPAATEPVGTAAPAADELPADSCEGIKKDMPCSTPGTCSALICGLADLGTRSCVCDANWTCTSCEFPTGADAPEVLVEPPSDMPLATCDSATVVEEEPCATMGERCALDDGDICACWLTDSDGATIWDCDSPPW